MEEKLKKASREETKMTYTLAAFVNGGAMCAALRSNMHWSWKAIIALQFAVFTANDIVKASLADEKAKLSTIFTKKTEES